MVLFPVKNLKLCLRDLKFVLIIDTSLLLFRHWICKCVIFQWDIIVFRTISSEIVKKDWHMIFVKRNQLAWRDGNKALEFWNFQCSSVSFSALMPSSSLSVWQTVSCKISALWSSKLCSMIYQQNPACSKFKHQKCQFLK